MSFWASAGADTQGQHTASYSPQRATPRSSSARRFATGRVRRCEHHTHKPVSVACLEGARYLLCGSAAGAVAVVAVAAESTGLPGFTAGRGSAVACRWGLAPARRSWVLSR
jgi:hypothetical protein